MKKAVVVIVTAILVIVFLIEPLIQMEPAKANMILRSSIEIQSPVNGENYQTSTVNVSVIINLMASTEDVDNISYSLDGRPKVALSILKESQHEYLGTGTLRNIGNGNHTLNAYFHIPYFKEKSTSTPTFFVVNAPDSAAKSNQTMDNNPLTIAAIALGTLIVGIVVAIVFFRTKKASKRIVGNGFES
jgi:hypothetical protein